MHRPCARKPYDSKGSEPLLGTDAVDVVVNATAARAGQIAAAIENSVAEPAPPTAETSAGSYFFLILGRNAAKQRRMVHLPSNTLRECGQSRLGSPVP